MRLVKKILLTIIVVALVLAGVGLLLPRKVHVERVATISAPPEAIMPLLDDLTQWPNWTAWTKERDPSLDVKFSGPRGVGAVYEWTSKNMGSGRLTLTKSDPQTGIAYEIFFEGEQTPIHGAINLDKRNGDTRVLWTFDGDMGYNLVGRYMGVFLMDKWAGDDFEKGLANLKQLAEGKK